MLSGKDKIQATLERLDRLTRDEGLSAVAQTLGVVHSIAGHIRTGGALYSRVYSQIFVLITIPSDGKAPSGGIGQNSGTRMYKIGIK